ncbi:hypothetical protein M9H77_25424 [Catharanthus roseus]|uniref:Uncharacterized protein n=1 Tax=Catharanthus roseus TaxID=4058 RepID=A0ACC0A7R2_CATRO|nr:hypothetical protein M9H77_25424 [Catharanthus roseus]
MGPGLGPSFTIRVRVWVWGYPEGLDPFTALVPLYCSKHNMLNFSEMGVCWYSAESELDAMLPVKEYSVVYPQEGHEVRLLLRGEWDIRYGVWFWHVDELLMCGCGCMQSGGWGSFVIHGIKLLWPAEYGFTHISMGAN